MPDTAAPALRTSDLPEDSTDPVVTTVQSSAQSDAAAEDVGLPDSPDTATAASTAIAPAVDATPSEALLPAVGATATQPSEPPPPSPENTAEPAATAQAPRAEPHPDAEALDPAERHADTAQPPVQPPAAPAVGPAPEVSPAQRHERALQAMRAGDYAEAFCIWRPLAEAGDPQAQFSLGWMYHNGYGLAIDDSKTLLWWRKAAAQQFADASFALGMLYSFGDGGAAERDLPRAVGHYLDAVRLGHDEAKAMLRTLLGREAKALAPVTAKFTAAEWRLIGSPASIKVQRANVRRQPSLQAEVLTRLDEGDQVVQLGREGHWVHITIPERLLSAWVHESLIE